MVSIQRIIGLTTTGSCKGKIAPMSLPFSILNMTISFSLTTVVAMIESDRMVSAPTVYERNMEESNQR